MSKSIRLSVLAAFLASAGALCDSTCRADFTNVQVVLHSTVTTSLGVRKVYRVYANFTNPADQMICWGSATGFSGPSTFHTGPCQNFIFYNSAGNTAPSQKVIDNNPDVEWDTFATVGISKYEQGVPFDQTSVTPGFPTFISGNTLNMADAAVCCVEGAAQARADFAGDGDAQLRVLLMQLTLRPENYPFGTIGFIRTRNAAGQYQQFFNSTWNILEPLGRCCTPSGECVITSHAACASAMNGHWLNCDSCGPCELTCDGDIVPLPGDGFVNVDDLLAVINGWGQCPQFTVCPADVVRDFHVNVDDLLFVINHWDQCPP